MPEETSLQKTSQFLNDVPPAVTVPGYTVASEEASQLPLLEYWQVLRRRSGTVVAVLLLVLLTVGITLLKQRPVYEATAVLYIDHDVSNSITTQPVIDLDTEEEAYLESVYKMLESRNLAKRVIQKLALDQSPEFKEEQEKSWFAPGSSWYAAKWKSTAARTEQDKDGQYSDLVSNFLSRLTVRPVRRSRLVEISFSAYDPVLAAKIVDALAAGFIDQNLEIRWLSTQKASDWLSNQLIGLKAKLEKSEEELQRYARQNSILLIDEKQNMTSQKLQELEDQYLKAEGDRIQKESVYKQFQTGGAQSIPGLTDNQAYEQLVVKLADVKREYSELSVTFAPDYPKLKRLQSQIDEYQNAVDKERNVMAGRIADEYQAALTRSTLLKQAVDAQTGEYNDVAAKSIQYSILKREVDTNRQLYDGLLQRLKEAGISAGLKASNIRVVDGAEIPRSPYKPRIAAGLVGALCVGLILGCGLAFLQEYLDDTMTTPDAVRRHLGLATLAAIPGQNRAKRFGYYGYGQRLLSRRATIDCSAYQEEAYRSLRASVLLSTPGQPPRVILVTSAVPREGKTTTTAKLGIALAQLGGRVLVLDSDLRRPHLSRALATKEPAAGLSSYLTGNSTLKESVIQTDTPNLFAMLSGPPCPNPAELLSSPSLIHLLQESRKEFDFVVMDSPPLLRVADARILALEADAVILITQAGVTPCNLVSQAKSQLESVNANLIGVVLNNLEFFSSDYKYYFDDGYGHAGYEPQGAVGAST